VPTLQKQTKPILLFNDECAVCRRIARWVKKSGHSKSGEASIIVQPIGDDPEALRLLDPDLDIWDAYATIHLLIPDGSMKLGGEAVAEVLRSLPNTKWFAWSFSISTFGFRPFQVILNMAYAILADVRPLFGCESCGRTEERESVAGNPFDEELVGPSSGGLGTRTGRGWSSSILYN
jgi:predicted DCC family thiol-disulfide oxidoreductase YuxK